MSTGRWVWALIPYPILSPSLTSRTVSVDVKHHGKEKKKKEEDVCRSELRNCVNKKVLGGSRLTHFLSHSFSVRNKPYRFCERKTPWRRKRGGGGGGGGRGKREKKRKISFSFFRSELRNCVNREFTQEEGLSFPIPFLSVPDKPYGFCGRKAPWKKKKKKKRKRRRRKKKLKKKKKKKKEKKYVGQSSGSL